MNSSVPKRWSREQPPQDAHCRLAVPDRSIASTPVVILLGKHPPGPTDHGPHAGRAARQTHVTANNRAHWESSNPFPTRCSHMIPFPRLFGETADDYAIDRGATRMGSVQRAVRWTLGKIWRGQGRARGRQQALLRIEREEGIFPMMYPPPISLNDFVPAAIQRSVQFADNFSDSLQNCPGIQLADQAAAGFSLPPGVLGKAGTRIAAGLLQATRRAVPASSLDAEQCVGAFPAF